jgi:hypothetical protein
MQTTGGCRCGAVRYTATAEPIATRVCWCRDCQYFAAGSATVNVIFPTPSVTLTGPLRSFVSQADSGNQMTRGFCEHCGTPVTSASNARPHLMILRAGTLDDPELARPAMTIWTESAPSWACIDSTLPANPRQPPPVA